MGWDAERKRVKEWGKQNMSLRYMKHVTGDKEHMRNRRGMKRRHEEE